MNFNGDGQNFQRRRYLTEINFNVHRHLFTRYVFVYRRHGVRFRGDLTRPRTLRYCATCHASFSARFLGRYDRLWTWKWSRPVTRLIIQGEKSIRKESNRIKPNIYLILLYFYKLTITTITNSHLNHHLLLCSFFQCVNQFENRRKKKL